jgi:hypothetical protein
MHALYVEVNANDSHVPAAREFLPNVAAPLAREMGATGGYWLAPINGIGVSVVAFDTEEAARAVAERFEVGKPPGPDAPEGVTVRLVEVREVLASV